jgi:FkbM family methyltransferase
MVFSRKDKYTLPFDQDIQRAIDFPKPHEVDFQALALPFIKSIIGDRVIVDVGANIGWSLVSMRKVGISNKVFSFEANRILIPTLKSVAKLYPESKVHSNALGSKNKISSLYTPSVDGVTYHQESSFNRSQFDLKYIEDRLKSYGNEIRLRRKWMVIRKLDTFKLKPGFIKIDVEGYESEVLNGGRKTIEECRPIIMLESGDRERVGVMASLQYERYFYNPSLHSLQREETSYNEFWIHSSFKVD